MKILFPLEVFYPSQAGGAANSVHYITKHLDKARFEPVVIATDRGLPEEFLKNHWIENEDGRVVFVTTFYHYLPVRAAAKSLWQVFGSDMIHLSSVFFPTAFITGALASLLKKKF